MRKLNVGCGQDVRPKSRGWTNLDMHGRLGADCIFDLNDLFKGKRLPFRDGEFDYVLCSHVLEDWIDPIPIMDELVRVTRKDGLIDLRVPYETTTWDGIYHKKPFNIITFQSYMRRDDYKNARMPLVINKVKFYTAPSSWLSIIINPVFSTKRFIITHIANVMIFFKKTSVDYSLIKYLMHNIFLQCVYRKTSS